VQSYYKTQELQNKIRYFKQNANLLHSCQAMVCAVVRDMQLQNYKPAKESYLFREEKVA